MKADPRTAAEIVWEETPHVESLLGLAGPDTDAPSPSPNLVALAALDALERLGLFPEEAVRVLRRLRAEPQRLKGLWQEWMAYYTPVGPDQGAPSSAMYQANVSLTSHLQGYPLTTTLAFCTFARANLAAAGSPSAQAPAARKKAKSTGRAFRLASAEHCAIIRDIYGNPYRRWAPAPEVLARNGGAALDVARGAAAELVAAPAASLPVLADALEEGGCEDGRVLSHLRTGPHWRGCWAVGAILEQGGKR